MKSIEKQKAINLRKKGFSMGSIARQLCVSKASVSVWVRDVLLTSKQVRKLAQNSYTSEAIEKRRKVRLSNENNKRRLVIENAKKEFNKLSNRDLKILGTMLYWAEGRKKGKRILSFANSDPIMIKVMMRFFRDICNVSEKRFRGHIHTFSQNNASTAETYWSHISGIPCSQFYKTYAKKSIASKDKRETLPYGTFDIYVCDTNLFLRIMGWIEKIPEIILKN